MRLRFWRKPQPTQRFWFADGTGRPWGPFTTEAERERMQWFLRSVAEHNRRLLAEAHRQGVI